MRAKHTTKWAMNFSFSLAQLSDLNWSATRLSMQNLLADRAKMLARFFIFIMCYSSTSGCTYLNALKRARTMSWSSAHFDFRAPLLCFSLWHFMNRLYATFKAFRKSVVKSIEKII